MIEEYDATRDREACLRIWDEVHWLDIKDKANVERTDEYWSGCSGWVARMDGSAECFVITSPGDMQYLDDNLPFAGIMGVTVSRVARKRGLAGRVTAKAIAAEVEKGAAVVGLGMFEQGYYNRLGFGSLHPDVYIAFDPKTLNVPVPKQVPARITFNDYKTIHHCRLNRRRSHGSLSFHHPMITKGNDPVGKKHFVLGFYDDAGQLTHHLMVVTKDEENGPYMVSWLAYRTLEEFMDLLGVIKSLDDQIRLVKMAQPPSVHMQDLIEGPLQKNIVSRGSKFQTGAGSQCWCQARISKLEACMAKTHLVGEPVRFNLVLDDPIEQFLDEDEPWRGCSGNYVMTLGPESEARKGEESGLPTMRASVNALTRLWLGAATPEWLTHCDSLEAPPELLASLTRLLRFPPPIFDWEF